jgi:hypothetical protein
MMKIPIIIDPLDVKQKIFSSRLEERALERALRLFAAEVELRGKGNGDGRGI